MPLPGNVRLGTVRVDRLGRVKDGTERGDRRRCGGATGGSCGGGVSPRETKLNCDTWKITLFLREFRVVPVVLVWKARPSYSGGVLCALDNLVLDASLSSASGVVSGGSDTRLSGSFAAANLIICCVMGSGSASAQRSGPRYTGWVPSFLCGYPQLHRVCDRLSRLKTPLSSGCCSSCKKFASVAAEGSPVSRSSSSPSQPVLTQLRPTLLCFNG